jgi:hypothetical protein
MFTKDHSQRKGKAMLRVVTKRWWSVGTICVAGALAAGCGAADSTPDGDGDSAGDQQDFTRLLYKTTWSAQDSATYEIQIHADDEGGIQVQVGAPMGAPELLQGRCALETFLTVAKPTDVVPPELLDECAPILQEIVGVDREALRSPLRAADLAPEPSEPKFGPAAAMTYAHCSANGDVDWTNNQCSSVANMVGQQQCTVGQPGRKSYCWYGFTQELTITAQHPWALNGDNATKVRFVVGACSRPAKYSWTKPGNSWSAEQTINAGYYATFTLYAGSESYNPCGWPSACGGGPHYRYKANNYATRARVDGTGGVARVAAGWVNLNGVDVGGCPLTI